ncbi:AMP-binding protein [Motiliproteus sp. MSK22-1]|uniref:AMP-binding protein n=1 Tax=Motiliproteus sp. MSK22-1 TaxID=1897630 RepID=UPI0009774F8C|nr:AMP-binding protein [Motiliproteus sp. MSK22-1]OMH38301.1 AMP-binding protein [Motiliproteus sp. MSK22-1]
MTSKIKSYTSGTSEKPLLGITIGDLFDQTVANYPDNEALIVRHQSIRWSYKELQAKVEDCAKALMALGIEKGDRVGIWSPNNSEWCITQFATAKVGAILVNINPAYRLHELEYALNQSECAFIIAADSFKSSDYSQMLYDLAPELKTCPPAQLKSSKLPNLHAVITLAQEPREGMLSWDQLMTRAGETSDEQLSQRQQSLEFDDPINIQYTSGTTGFPKGASLSHHNILNNGYFVAESQRFTDQDRLVIPVPLYHCFGMVMGNLGCVSHGATMIYPDEAFEPEIVLKTVAEERATALYGVPTMFIAQLEHPDFQQYDLSSLRTGIMAGATCPIEVMKQVIEKMHMSEVQIAYGMTETSPVSTQSAADDPIEKRVSTVGRTQPHLETKIISPDGQVVPRGEIGELCTRGYSVMLGYWNNEEATKSAIDSAGWMHTGDLATMDEEGYTTIVGRNKDMIIRGGENIYPREIEEFLYTHPAVSDVQVTGVPDKKFGEELIAWIILKEGEEATEEEIKDFCKGKISHFKVPRYFKFTDAFPMTVTGKIQKFRMREVSIDELGLSE